MCYIAFIIHIYIYIYIYILYHARPAAGGGFWPGPTVIPGRVCHCHRPRSAGTTTVRDVIMMLLAAWLRRRPAPYHVTRTGSGSLAGPGPGHWLALAWRDSLRLVPGGCPQAHWQGLAQAPSQVECRGAATVIPGRSRTRAPSQPVSLGTPWPRRGSAGESHQMISRRAINSSSRIA
jgi:hypothetical protein